MVPDAHLPLEDRPALGSVINYLETQYLDILIIAGDWADLGMISKMAIGKPGLHVGEYILEELNYCHKGLQRIVAAARTRNADCKVVLIQGNHEERIERLYEACPAFTGAFDIEDHWHLKENGVLWVPFWSKRQIFKYGKSIFIHGNYTTKYHPLAMAADFRMPVLYGHTHDLQHMKMKGFDPTDTVWAQSCGYLGKYRLPYLKQRNTNWQHGFVRLFWDADGVCQPLPIRITRGKFVGQDGVLYTS